jgi:hypothetical protein
LKPTIAMDVVDDVADGPATGNLDSLLESLGFENIEGASEVLQAAGGSETAVLQIDRGSGLKAFTALNTETAPSFDEVSSLIGA